MRLVVRDPPVNLGRLRRSERGLIGFWGDSVPQILNVEDALGGGHVVEGGFHVRIVVASKGDRHSPATSDTGERDRNDGKDRDRTPRRLVAPGDLEVKFKVNLWAGKGGKVIYSSRFLCTNTEWEEPPVTVSGPTVPFAGAVPGHLARSPYLARAGPRLSRGASIT